MTAPTPTAQVEQHHTTRLNINFSHRLSWAVTDFDTYAFDAYSLSGTVDEMSDRATAILNMLAAQFIGEEPDVSILNFRVIAKTNRKILT